MNYTLKQIEELLRVIHKKVEANQSKVSIHAPEFELLLEDFCTLYHLIRDIELELWSTILSSGVPESRARVLVDRIQEDTGSLSTLFADSRERSFGDNTPTPTVPKYPMLPGD